MDRAKTKLNQMDQELAARLSERSSALLASDCSLCTLLRAEEPNIQRAFVLHWIPEQGEEIFTVLVNSKTILIVEIPRDAEDTSGPTIERLSVASYARRQLGKPDRRELNVALFLQQQAEQDAVSASEE